jgi:hypothetical protein
MVIGMDFDELERVVFHKRIDTNVKIAWAILIRGGENSS